MSTTKTTPDKPGLPSALRALPAVVCFDGDTLAQKAVAGCQRYARLAYAAVEGREAETIIVVSSERLLAQFQPLLRAPNIRIIALSDTRYRDARLDGAVFGYLPANTPPALLERMMDNALDHIHLVASRREANERLAGAHKEISELNAIGAALSAEHDTDRLLDMVLTKAREITRSDAGSLYLVEEVPLDTPELPAENPGPEPATAAPEFAGARLVTSPREKTRKVLRFKLAQNDTVAVPFAEVLMEISDQSIAGYVVQTGEIVNLEDAYHLPEMVPYTFNRKIDESSGYRTKSMLTAPMKDMNGEVVGVLQLINAKRSIDAALNSLAAVVSQVVPYTVRQQEMVASLASQAAVALANSRLYSQQQRLFQGFAEAAVTAIEMRDPTTFGHSKGVRNLTIALAEAADRATDGPYKDLSFTREQMKEIWYAALLHDVGKITVRERVLVKAKKLYPEQLDLLKQRFQFVKRSMQVESLQSRLQYILAKGREDYLSRQPEFDASLAQQLQEVDGFFATVLQANEPSVMPVANFDQQLLEIAARHFLNFDGDDQPLLTPDEVRFLSIRRGTLDDYERQEIEQHAVQTFNFLNHIVWTREMRNIPEIARGHHEKLNGSGYPRKLAAPDIPLQTRMMTICDIFDALSAKDRPYKRAVSPERALQILDMEVNDGNLDPNLFKLFLEAKVYERWKIEPSPY